MIEELIDLICQDKDYTREILKDTFGEYYAKNLHRIITYKKENRIIAFAHYLMLTTEQLQLIDKYGKDAMKVIKDTEGENIFVTMVVMDKENRGRNIPLKMARFLIKQQSQAKTFNWLKKDEELISYKLNGREG